MSMAALHRRPSRLTIVLLLFAAAAATAVQQAVITRAGCPDKCGDVSIPFPFGTVPGCFLPGFEVNCNASFTPPRAFLPYNIKTGPWQVQGSLVDDQDGVQNYSVGPVELMDVSPSKSEARAYGAVSSLCFTNLNSSIIKIQATRLVVPFQLSVASNELVGVGWNVEAIAWDNSLGVYNISCSGPNDCQANISEATAKSSFGASITRPRDGNTRWQTNPCSYSMLVERSWYNFSADDTSGYEVLPGRYPRGVPFVMDFAITDAGSCPAEGQPPPPGFACISGNSTCANATTGQGYVCKCLEHYDGNPYIPNGCQELPDLAIRDAGSCPAEGQPPPPGFACISGNSSCANATTGQGYVCKCLEHYGGNPNIPNGCQDINECDHPDLYPCSPHGVCKNRLEGYDCPCKAGTCTQILPLPAKVVLGEC